MGPHSGRREQLGPRWRRASRARWRHGIVAVAILLCAGCRRDRPPLLPSPEPLPAEAYAHYLRGRVAAFEGNYARAVRELEAAAKRAPGEAPIHVALAEAHYRAGQRHRARSVLESAQKRWPESPRVWRSSGDIYAALLEHRLAARAYQKTIALIPDDEDSYYRAAAARDALGERKAADQIYRTLLRRLPDSPDANYRYGERMAERGQRPLALRHLSRAIELEPDHLKARVSLARLLRILGRVDEAVATLQIAFDRSEGDSRVGRFLFRELLEAGDRQRAIGLISDLDRDDLEVDDRVDMGFLLLHAGAIDKALAAGRKLMEQHPGEVGPIILTARSLRARGDTDEAIELLLKVPPSALGYARARSIAAETLATTARPERALEVIDEGFRTHPSSSDLHLARALALEMAGDVDGARNELKARLRRGESGDDARYVLAGLEERQGNYDEALRVIWAILKRDRNNASALNFIGFSLADRDVDLPRARRLLTRALELDPDNGFVLDSWGWLLFREGKPSKALAPIERAVRLEPAEPEILWHLGEVYLALGRKQAGVQAIERARQYAVETGIRQKIEKRLQALR